LPLLIQDRNFTSTSREADGQLIHKTDPDVMEAFRVSPS